MTQEQIEQCHHDWAVTEMSDLDRQQLKSERLDLYNKWFVKLLDHARQVERQNWNAGL